MKLKHFVLAAVALALAACATAPPPGPPPITAWRGAEVTRGDLRRVAVLPFQNETAYPEEADAVAEALLDEVRKSGRFEAFPLRLRAEEDAGEVARRRGEFRKELLMELRTSHGADAALFGVITAYSPYLPPRLGVKLELVSTRTGEVAWSAEGLLDAAEARTTEDMKRYYKESAPEGGSLYDWQLLLYSPQRFLRYACQRLAATL
jgi:hypothetical protein